MIFEVCVDSAAGGAAAQEGGAQRIELCDNLVEGGTTPSLGMVEVTRTAVTLDVNVIIRPRGGDFFYSPLEFEVMRRDIQAVKKAGVNGVVFGLLLKDGTIDYERMRPLVDTARPMSVTFHRAFDLCQNAGEAMETLVELGIERILTSGQKPNALEGMECIAQLVRQANGRIVVMAGAGLNKNNLAKIVAATGVNEVHFSARREFNSPMVYRNAVVNMGKSYQPQEYARKITDANLVQAMILSLAHANP